MWSVCGTYVEHILNASNITFSGSYLGIHAINACFCVERMWILCGT